MLYHNDGLMKEVRIDLLEHKAVMMDIILLCRQSRQCNFVMLVLDVPRYKSIYMNISLLMLL